MRETVVVYQQGVRSVEEIKGFADALGGFSQVTASGLLGYFVISILRGDLIPAKTSRLLQENGDKWREVALKHIETSRVQASTIETLMEVGRNADHVLQSLPSPNNPQGPSNSGGEVQQ
jgi:hypothetical protein